MLGDTSARALDLSPRFPGLSRDVRHEGGRRRAAPPRSDQPGRDAPAPAAAAHPRRGRDDHRPRYDGAFRRPRGRRRGRPARGGPLGRRDRGRAAVRHHDPQAGVGRRAAERLPDAEGQPLAGGHGDGAQHARGVAVRRRRAEGCAGADRRPRPRREAGAGHRPGRVVVPQGDRRHGRPQPGAAGIPYEIVFLFEQKASATPPAEVTVQVSRHTWRKSSLDSTMGRFDPAVIARATLPMAESGQQVRDRQAAAERAKARKKAPRDGTAATPTPGARRRHVSEEPTGPVEATGPTRPVPRPRRLARRAGAGVLIVAALAAGRAVTSAYGDDAELEGPFLVAGSMGRPVGPRYADVTATGVDGSTRPWRTDP